MDVPVLLAIALALLGAAVGFAIARRRAAAEPVPERIAGQEREQQSADRPLDEDGLALAAAIQSGVLHVDPSGRIDWSNAAAATLLGRPSGGLVGRSVMEAFLDRRIETLVASARPSASTTTELPSRDSDGRVLVVRARRSPTRGVWLVLEDVTELRRLQQIRAEFIDNLSHELRTPLTTISLLAETLSRDAEAAGDAIPTRMRERIGKVEEETGHLVQMVTELLDLSRIESGPPLALNDLVDLGRLAAASAERLRLFAERQGVHLIVDVPDGLPPVRGDEERLGQVFVNLLHNAVKFSPDGGDVIVRGRSETETGEVEVEIEDHGVGIPRSAQPRVFERFYKVDRARVRGGGTGLGLSIARHIVEAHGGRIELESEDGRGSTFAVILPVATDAAGHPADAGGSVGDAVAAGEVR